MLLVSCVQTCSEIGTPFPDVVLFPEYGHLSEVAHAQALNPNSMIIGAVVEEDPNHVLRSRGLLFHHSENRIDYLKIGMDGWTQGTKRRPEQLPVYRYSAICIGVLLCMDVQEDETFARDVIMAVKSAPVSFKFICIPAAMTASAWNWSAPLGPKWEGVHVLLCNNLGRAFQPACKSFIATPHGIKIIEQFSTEPLRASLAVA